MLKLKYENQNGEVKDYTVNPIAVFMTKDNKPMISLEKLPDDGSPLPEGTKAQRRTFHLAGIKEVNGAPLRLVTAVLPIKYEDSGILKGLKDPEPGEMRIAYMEDGQIARIYWRFFQQEGVVGESFWEPEVFPMPKPTKEEAT